MTPPSLATGARVSAAWMPQPPMLRGKVACVQASAVRGRPTMAVKASFWACAIPAAISDVRRAGRERSRCYTLLGLKHCRSKECATCGSSSAAIGRRGS